MDNLNIENLSLLKKEYSSGSVSALIGAGFSKNVSPLYMDWDTLLQDIIEDLYKLEMQQYIRNEFHWKNKSKYKRDSEKRLKKEFANHILNKEGYLGVVSKYIAQKGYREVIENYIEDRTPYAKKDTDGNMSLYIKDKKKNEIKVSDFSAHKQLLLCEKFKNIYTTNYDNLLEFTAENLLDKTNKIPCVKTSFDLSDGFQKRSIIKIHGNLKTDENAEFCFDYDNHLRYIISQEDYNTYIEKHEAFSHLMRISMLQGKFCLLGFSGNDPNYMGWLKWINDILYKGPYNEPKIYLVTFKNEQSSEKKLYYKNHYIREINLMDNEILSFLGYSQSEIMNLLSSIPSSYKEVIKCFLEYLCKTSDRIQEETSSNSSDEYEYNYNNEKSKESEKLKLELPSTDNTISFDYKKLWQEASSKYYKQEDLSEIKVLINDTKIKLSFCKEVYYQEQFIETTLRRKGDLSEAEAYLFALAVKETGQLPNYYSKFLNDKPKLNDIPLWQELVEREKTLEGNFESLQGDSDYYRYENIQRKLLRLDFEEAKKLLDNWEANGFWLQAKAMRLAGYNEKEEALNSLNTYINDVSNLQEKMYACNIANYISNIFPRPYNLDNFFKNHIYGQSDIISYISEKLRNQEEDLKVRGWIGTIHHLNSSNTQYEQSLRFLQFIFETGLYLSYGITNFVDKKVWYKVFNNIYKDYPYPCFFYSLQYHDKTVLDRIGQDFAFCPNLLETNEKLLISSIKAYGSENTPKIFLPGILSITGPLYLCVDESVWFDVFKTNIFEEMIAHISEYTDNEKIVDNIEYAVSRLKNEDHILIVLEYLLSHMKDNATLVDSIICNNIQLKYLKNGLDNTCTALLNEIINEYPKIDITNIIYFFNKNKCLPNDSLQHFISKLKANLDDIPTDTSSLFHLCILTEKKNEIINKAKQKLLEKDIWNSGILDDGKGWSNPDYIPLHKFNSIKKWNNTEFGVISNNLKENILKYSSLSEKLGKDSFMRNAQVAYLSNVLEFINSLSDKRKEELKDIKEITQNLLKSRVSYNSFIEAMLSEQSSDVSNGIDNIVQGIRSYGLKQYYNEINFLVDRAIIGEEIAMAKNLSVVKWLIKNYEQDFKIMGIESKLLILLSVYKERWQNMEEFRPDLSFGALHTIASYLKNSGSDNEDIKYWLTNEFVQIFL